MCLAEGFFKHQNVWIHAHTIFYIFAIVLLASHSVSENSDLPLFARHPVAEREGGKEGRREWLGFVSVRTIKGRSSWGRDRQKHRVEKNLLYVIYHELGGSPWMTLLGFSEIEIARTDRYEVLWYHCLCGLLSLMPWFMCITEVRHMVVCSFAHHLWYCCLWV